jgi:hypothetical protein
MRKPWIASLVVILGLLGPSVVMPAAALDGTKPFLCAVVLALECERDGSCEQRTPEEMNFPQFIRIDPQARTLASAEAGGRSAPVHDMTTVNGNLVLHGGQLGRGWSAVVANDTGKLSASIVDAGATFVIFGACTGS